MVFEQREDLPKRGLKCPRRLGGLLGGLALGLAVLAGCQKGPDTPPETATRLRRLLLCLCDYVEATNRAQAGRPKEEGFKAYLAKLPKERLAGYQITNVQEMFVSPRDHQPFVINYNIPLGGPTPAIWEQTGVDGRRYLITVDGKVEELGNEQFERAFKQ